jgi:hypothetical protein
MRLREYEHGTHECGAKTVASEILPYGRGSETGVGHYIS